MQPNKDSAQATQPRKVYITIIATIMNYHIQVGVSTITLSCKCHRSILSLLVAVLMPINEGFQIRPVCDHIDSLM